MKTHANSTKLPKPVSYEDYHPDYGACWVSTILTHRRPSKAQLRAVQAALNDPSGEIDIVTIEVFGLPGTTSRALGLHRKPGQHAGEKRKK